MASIERRGRQVDRAKADRYVQLGCSVAANVRWDDISRSPIAALGIDV